MGIREVEYSELPESFYGRFVIAAGSLLSLLKQPQVGMLDLGYPPLPRTVSINSAIARFISALHALVGTVLSMRTLSKVIASIIKTISIYMVNFILCIQHNLMHINDSLFGTANCIMATFARFFGLPLVLTKTWIVAWTNHSGLSFCKRNDKVILRLGSLLKQVAHRNTLRCAGLAALLYFSITPVFAMDSVKGWCEEGGKKVVTSGLQSTTLVQASHPSCIITVYVHGGGLATIYADNNLTPLANPFTAQSGGRWQAYSQNGRYDVVMSSAGFSQTVTYSDIILCDPFETGSTCNNGGTVQAHNLLSTTHLDTVPESPPVRGDLITAQNTTSPSSVTPAWAALPIGTNGQVLTSTGVDAVWGNLVAGTNITISSVGGNTTINATGGGSGCTLPGLNFGVLSEHPASTCYDSSHWTWDDTSNRQVMQAGLSNTVSATLNDGFVFGGFNTVNGSSATQVRVIGDNNAVGASGTVQEIHVLGFDNTQSNSFRSFLIGLNNTVTDVQQDIFTIGDTNTVQSATPGSVANIRHCYLTGEDNTLTGVTGSRTIENCAIIGFGNAINQQATASGTSIHDIFIAGENNTITSTTATLVGISGIHIMGADNLVQDVANLTEEVEIVGEQNTVNGAFSTAEILGFLNTATNVTPSTDPASTATMVGLSNSISGSPTGTNAIAMTVGSHLSLSNCTDCFLYGRSGTSSASNFIGIGLSSTPELQWVTSSSKVTVLRAPVAFSSLPACAAGTEGGFAAITDSNTNVWGATISGSSTNHVLGYCDGTNWTVAGK